MSRSLKFVISSILITVIVLGLSSPVKAQVLPPTIYVDAPSTVTVSTEFDIIISIRDIPSGWGMVLFEIGVDWDPNDLEYIGCEFLGDGRPGWDGGCGGDASGAGGGGDDDRDFPVSRWTEDAEWLRFRFHCLQAGPTPITVYTLDETFIIENLGNGQTVEVYPENVTVTVNQVAPVGGISTPINKLELLTPYLAIAGIIAAISTIYVIKKRKD
ncbi:hypothetical protein ACFLQ6_05565 [Thermoproteota archaeon]